jgi:hypothetical protein
LLESAQSLNVYEMLGAVPTLTAIVPGIEAGEVAPAARDGSVKEYADCQFPVPIRTENSFLKLPAEIVPSVFKMFPLTLTPLPL